MSKQSFNIPNGSNYVSVEATDNKLIISFSKENPNMFFCQESEHIEETPLIGHLSIFWDFSPSDAIISKVADIDYSDCTYKAKNGVWYRHAVRFRSEEQYSKILQSNVAKVEAKKE